MEDDVQILKSDAEREKRKSIEHLNLHPEKNMDKTGPLEIIICLAVAMTIVSGLYYWNIDIPSMLEGFAGASSPDMLRR